MNKFAGLVLVLFFTVQSQAQLKKVYQRAKQAVTGSATLAQLHYFPEQWEFDLTLGYRYTNIDIKGTVTGITALEASQKQSLLKSTFTLGILDNVYAQLNWDYLAQMETSYSKPATTPSTKSKGAEDPEIDAVIRLVEGSSVKLDAKVGFQPSTGDHQEADANNDGDAKEGGHAVTVGGRMVALITDSSQLQASAEYKMLSLQNSVDQSSGSVSEAEKHNQVQIQIGTLTALTSDLYFGVNLEIANTDSYTSTDLNTQAKTSNGSISAKTVDLIGKYMFSQDSLVEIQAGYVIDYSQTIGNLELSATGYSLNANYTVRF